MTAIRYLLLAAAACFVLGLHLMNHPARARRGNLLSGAGMLAAVAAAVALLVDGHTITLTGWIVVLCAVAVGSTAGLYAARSVQMTAMPQLVSVFNAVGGGAAALLAVSDLIGAGPESLPARTTVPAALGIIIGAVTFSGSVLAAGKLQGIVPGHPIVFPGARAVNLALAAAFAGCATWLVLRPHSVFALVALAGAALVFGVTMVLPIGGADKREVLSLW